jgi:hypothetical protein
LQPVHGFHEVLRPAELSGDLDDIPVRRQRRHLQQLGYLELVRAMLGVLVEQLVQNSPRLRAVLVEEVFAILAQRLGPFLPRPQRSIIPEVAEQVERIRVGPTGRAPSLAMAW